MMAALSALALAWQASTVIELKGSTPGVCAIRYVDDEAGLEISVEKRDIGNAVVTALAVRGAGVTAARLRTASVDTQIVLKPVAPRAGERFRAEAVLEDDDAGARLVHDLAIGGGQIDVTRGTGTAQLELPHPLSREVVAQYLNCTGDLVIPY